jgi:hypothetical protein
MECSNMDDTAQRSKERLAALPALLSSARELLVQTFKPGDAEVDSLKAQIEECAVAAHRLVLRERMRPPRR